MPTSSKSVTLAVERKMVYPACALSAEAEDLLMRAHLGAERLEPVGEKLRLPLGAVLELGSGPVDGVNCIFLSRLEGAGCRLVIELPDRGAVDAVPWPCEVRVISLPL